MSQSEFEHWRRGVGGRGLTRRNSLGGGFQALLLGGLRLWFVLLKQGEQLSRLVLVEGSIKLVDGRRNLETLEKNLLLTLQSDISRPPDESTEVFPFRL